MLPWEDIDTVLLDMDGTLLDLHFDNHFWREHIPRRYAEIHGVDLDDARQDLYARMTRIEGTMDWYCLDYWSRELGLDVAVLKEEVDHLIAVHPFVPEFLDGLKAAGKRRVLVTNAHTRSLALKMERTDLAGRLDAVICAHDLGLPKEDVGFWERLQTREPFDPARSLLVDDNLDILRSARGYGIAHLLGVYQPDSQAAPRDGAEFEVVRSFCDLLPSFPGLFA